MNTHLADSTGWINLVNRRRVLLAIGAFVAAVYMMLVSGLPSIGMMGFGGVQSKWLIDRFGVTNSSLLIATPTNSGGTVVGLAPTVSTVPAIYILTQATLQGNVSSLNGAASAVVFFRWGYSPTTMTNTTATQILSAPGTFSAVVSGLQGEQIFYQAVSESDGTSYGDTLDAQDFGFFIFRVLILPLLVVAAMFAALLKWHTPLAAGLILLFGVLLYVILSMIISAL